MVAEEEIGEMIKTIRSKKIRNMILKLKKELKKKKKEE